VGVGAPVGEGAGVAVAVENGAAAGVGLVLTLWTEFAFAVVVEFGDAAADGTKAIPFSVTPLGAVYNVTLLGVRMLISEL
jgi:hypothetical protein